MFDSYPKSQGGGDFWENLNLNCFGQIRCSRSWLRILVSVWIFGLLFIILHFYGALETSPFSPFSLHNPCHPTVAVVIAHTTHEDISWTRSLPSQIPNLHLIPYTADDPSAPYHPLENTGNEAMIYLTYFIEFYSSLPDFTFLIHAQDDTWHMDRPLYSSTAYAITHLNLSEVERRGYVSLRLFLPSRRGLNTTENTADEGPYMASAFLENFPGENDGKIPELLGGACCSQFSVTRERILSRGLEEYKAMRDWLIESELEGKISGRLWEHMWPWLFLRRALEMPVDWKALCTGWRICFRSQKAFNEWLKKNDKLDSKMEMRKGYNKRNGQRLGTHEWGVLNDEIAVLEEETMRVLEEAVIRGKDEEVVEEMRRTLYVDESGTENGMA